MLISIGVAVMIFMSGMIMLNFIRTEVTNVRSSDDLDCANFTVISDGNKLTCLVVDTVIPYWIIIIVSFSGGIIINRFL